MTAADQTILLVEDDVNDVLLIERAFHKAGLSNPLQAVTNGESAIAYLSGDGAYADRQRYPLPVMMLVDLKLPRRTGLEFLDWIRAQPVLKRLPVVVLTSSAQMLDVNRAYEAGANSYVVKPVGFDDLMSLVRSVVRYWTEVSEQPTLSPP